MDDLAPQKKSKSTGAPAWMATFADLMSLLMCFFVLLLSFSEIDLQKYKQVAGSMAMAFGVQDETFATKIPKGTSFVAREYSPGRPDPKPIKMPSESSSGLQQTASSPSINRAVLQHVQSLAERIRSSLRLEINRGMVDVETESLKIIIRIHEKNVFPSGSTDLMGDFKGVIAKIARILLETPGRIVVAGHTDNIPIHGARFRSNWELSASRAVTVVHELLNAAPVDEKRFLVEGHGEMRPLAANDSAANRAHNRRVEIVLEQDPLELTKILSQKAQPQVDPLPPNQQQAAP
jgi:chemotaxis protein MotB